MANQVLVRGPFERFALEYLPVEGETQIDLRRRLLEYVRRIPGMHWEPSSPSWNVRKLQILSDDVSDLPGNGIDFEAWDGFSAFFNPARPAIATVGFEWISSAPGLLEPAIALRSDGVQYLGRLEPLGEAPAPTVDTQPPRVPTLWEDLRDTVEQGTMGAGGAVGDAGQAVADAAASVGRGASSGVLWGVLTFLGLGTGLFLWKRR